THRRSSILHSIIFETECRTRLENTQVIMDIIGRLGYCAKLGGARWARVPQQHFVLDVVPLYGTRGRRRCSTRCDKDRIGVRITHMLLGRKSGLVLVLPSICCCAPYAPNGGG